MDRQAAGVDQQAQALGVNELLQFRGRIGCAGDEERQAIELERGDLDLPRCFEDQPQSAAR